MPDSRSGLLFPLGESKPVEPEIRRLPHPIWTKNKAKLIERYLYYFVMITKHGTYIDAFAGPQRKGESDEEMWSAQLVLQSDPRWLRHFYLFEKDDTQVQHLRSLRDQEAPLRDRKHKIEVFPGDCNEELPKFLASRPIKDNEATFCLLDQRTFECSWNTAKCVAEYKPQGQHKIELFYFLPVGWLDRALAALKDEERLRAWWGRDDTAGLRAARPAARREMFVDRFRGELGYASVKAWPIWSKQDRGRVMYYMIHATDHPDAPKLMDRAYRKAVDDKEPIEQLNLDMLLKAKA